AVEDEGHQEEEDQDEADAGATDDEEPFPDGWFVLLCGASTCHLYAPDDTGGGVPIGGAVGAATLDPSKIEMLIVTLRSGEPPPGALLETVNVVTRTARGRCWRR